VNGRVDVHSFSPGMGWIPWWKSEVYPADMHYMNWEKRTGLKSSEWGTYMKNGGDLLEVFIEECQKTQQQPFISLRLNDTHNMEYLSYDSLNTQKSEWISTFCINNIDYLIDSSNYRSGFNWAYEHIPNHKLAFIEEIAANYTIAGIELDFMRFPSYFNLDETSLDERQSIMDNFIKSVRIILDTTSINDQHRYLCLKIPSYLSQNDDMGIDIEAFEELGVDMVIIAAFFTTIQQGTDFNQIRQLVPKMAVYKEIYHVIMNDSFKRIMTYDEQYYTTANLAYYQGADGISLFNYMYIKNSENSRFFDIIDNLKNREVLVKNPQHWYFHAREWLPPYINMEHRINQLPRMINNKISHYKLDIYIQDSLYSKESNFRILTESNCTDCIWDIKINGRKVKPKTENYSFLKTEYYFGERDRWADFIIPPFILMNGTNTVSISLENKELIKLVYYDVIFEY